MGRVYPSCIGAFPPWAFRVAGLGAGIAGRDEERER